MRIVRRPELMELVKNWKINKKITRIYIMED